jgi:hypothetical protein
MNNQRFLIGTIWAFSLAGAFWAGSALSNHQDSNKAKVAIPTSSDFPIVGSRPKTEPLIATKQETTDPTLRPPQTEGQKADTLLEVANEDFLAIHIANWLESDLTAAGKWLNAKPQDPRLDDAVGEFAIKASKHDPEVAFDWALSIVDERKRLNTLSSVGRSFRNQNPQGFDKKISSLSPAEQEKIESVTKPKQRYSGGGTFYASPDGNGRVAFTMDSPK